MPEIPAPTISTSTCSAVMDSAPRVTGLASVEFVTIVPASARATNLDGEHRPSGQVGRCVGSRVEGRGGRLDGRLVAPVDLGRVAEAPPGGLVVDGRVVDRIDARRREDPAVVGPTR